MTTSNDHQRIANAFDAFVYVVQSIYADRVAEAVRAARRGVLGAASATLDEYEAMCSMISDRVLALSPDAEERERMELCDAAFAVMASLVPCSELAELVDNPVRNDIDAMLQQIAANLDAMEARRAS